MGQNTADIVTGNSQRTPPLFKFGELCNSDAVCADGDVCTTDTCTVTDGLGRCENEAIVRSLLPVKFFSPKYLLGHPEHYSFLLSKKMFSGSKYPKI